MTRLSKPAALSFLTLVLALGTVTLGWRPAGTPPGTKRLPAAPPNVLLLTLDTTRADALGTRTPVLDGLAARGVRWTQAITSTPLTLPAHSSLFTGLVPPEHGVQVNGTDVLPRGVPTLAEAFASRGYRTAGLVATLVLDRRFGLDRGFQHYDDKVPGEPVNERNARQMTDAAVEWLKRQPGGKPPGGKPLFLWVHYFDPHDPYSPPGVDPKTGAAQRYAGEVAFMDQEIGRLLAALPGGAERWLIAAVADHGESLGEHGERNHGVFLYHSTLHVPLILAGPGVPGGKAVAEAVSPRRLAATLLRLSGPGREAASFGQPLPGLPGIPGVPSGAASPAYLASRYPLTAYGWSPLEGMFDGRFKLIVAPRPELYDLTADPGETRNLIGDQREPARRLKAALAAAHRSFQVHPADTADASDPELASSLESLGYLSSSGSSGKGTLDPKDGVPLLAEVAAAQELTQRGNPREAVARLTKLVRRNPGGVHFLTALAAAQLASGDGDAAIATYRRAAQENPRRDESHRNLAEAYVRLNRQEEASKEYELALKLNPRSAATWLSLADLAQKARGPAEVRRLLNQAVDAGTRSVTILMRLAEIEAKAGDGAAAERHFQQAADLAPDRLTAWMALGKIAESQGKLDRALQFYLKAAQADPRAPTPLLRAGHVLQRKGDGKGARQALEKVIVIAPGSAEAREAREALLSRPAL
ncbi:MAG TPA: sulfatase-like hydrolase/transferase [Thermoanaerobaculia bacterium]|nr:sulfatase-like hydrolase/transferase [Thermoanaerobaculia bacterium]